MRNNSTWLILSAIVIVLDQITKFWIEANLPHYGVIPVVDHFNIVHLRNTGAAFSMFNQAPALVFIVLAAAVCAGILAWLRKHPRGETLTAIGLCLIMGGAIGNVIDRVRLGHVTDFLDFYWGTWHFAAFNVADMAISVGAGFLILDMLLEWKRGPKGDL